MITKTDKLCFVRGHEGVHDVVVFGDHECKVRSRTTNETFTISTSKCWMNLDLRIQTHHNKRAAAATIGMPKIKPGKR